MKDTHHPGKRPLDLGWHRQECSPGKLSGKELSGEEFSGQEFSGEEFSGEEFSGGKEEPALVASAEPEPVGRFPTSLAGSLSTGPERTPSAPVHLDATGASSARIVT